MNPVWAEARSALVWLGPNPTELLPSAIENLAMCNNTDGPGGDDA